MNLSTHEKIERDFHKQMIRVYRSAQIECNYTATRFVQMVSKDGGLCTAKKLLASPIISHGLTELHLCGRLDISMENLVLQKPWRELFTDAELALAEQRLIKLGFDVS